MLKIRLLKNLHNIKSCTLLTTPTLNHDHKIDIIYISFEAERILEDL
jgi:hypothetical protein